MKRQKSNSLWVSHSSISDFLTCPRAYYLKQVYKDPRTNHKINLINPSLALGQIVHQVLESLSLIKAEDRLKQPLMEQYNAAWENISGELGGFRNAEEELEYKNRGAIMINRVLFHPGPLLDKAVKLVSPDSLPPRYYISQEDDIILCGKVDWLQYVPEDDSVQIIDFKTGVNEEKETSLQLPIYMLLVKNCQNRKVSGISYWYLEKDNEPKQMPMPNLDDARDMVLSIALKMKEARAKNVFVCPKGGCFACKPLEKVLTGEAKFVSTSDYQDIYIIPPLENPKELPAVDVTPF